MKAWTARSVASAREEDDRWLSSVRPSCSLMVMVAQGQGPPSHLRDVSVEPELVGEAKESSAMDIVVHLKNEADFEARNVHAFIIGDAEVKGMVEAEVLYLTRK